MSAENIRQFVTDAAEPLVDVSIVMPCLNEAQCLAVCIANAAEALAMIEQSYGLTGEILVADNGSTDGSQGIAVANGARVHAVPVRGYGAALIGGGMAARGRFVVFGDADGSYDFRESVAMVGELIKGADLCMGSRFKGGIAPGAMPWKNRHIGNPVLTGLLNLMFRTRISDAHCGLRAVRKDAFVRMRLSGTGMEFASEMVIKAALQKCTIAEVPATLSPDLRDRAPHLRPWRDGWRHLRYLFMLSPTSVFAIPAAAALTLGLSIFMLSFLDMFAAPTARTFGASWSIVGGALIGIGHIGALLAMATHIHGVREGYRLPTGLSRRFEKLVNLETMVVGGLILLTLGVATLAGVGIYWSAAGYAALDTVVPVVGGSALLALGMQTILGGFMLAVVGGNEADFLRLRADQAMLPPGLSPAEARIVRDVIEAGT